jgi:hypothetical protein
VSTPWPAADTTGSIRGSGIPEIRNGRGDSVGRTEDAIEPVSTEPITAQAAAEGVIEIVDAEPIEQTARVDDVLQRTAAAERTDRLSHVGHRARQPVSCQPVGKIAQSYWRNASSIVGPTRSTAIRATTGRVR